MRSRWLLNSILAIVIAALAAIVYFRPGGEETSVDPSLTTLAADTVGEIHIVRTGREPITLQKKDTVWRMTTPIAARANQFNIDSLLRVLSTTSTFRIDATETQLANYGLDKPSVQLRLNDEEIVVGAAHPSKPQHYVLHRGVVHLIPSYSLGTAFLGYAALIDTQLLIEGQRLAELRIPGIHLVHKNGSWQREPIDEKISVDRLNELVAEWQNARALSVERLSSRPTLDQVQIVFDGDGKNETLTVDVLAYKPQFVLARRDEGLEYHFPEEIAKRLLTLEPKNE